MYNPKNFDLIIEAIAETKKVPPESPFSVLNFSRNEKLAGMPFDDIKAIFETLQNEEKVLTVNTGNKKLEDYIWENSAYFELELPKGFDIRDWHTHYKANKEKRRQRKTNKTQATTARKMKSEEEADYKQYEYKCEDKIFISGTIPQNRSNRIVVNSHKIKIGDSLFELLLQFVVAIKKKKDGWITFNILVGNYQKFSNLRTALAGSLLGKDGSKFIENDGSKKYRISTHPHYIRYDRNKLLKHPTRAVRDLAKQLPRR